jgi:2-polyprenyl-3-methyl-5-hydroxy-6-metoxy-1,4-benzoquinol methylase
MADTTPSNAGHYDTNYENFESEIYTQIRREAYQEDLGQNSWLTADELLRFIAHLGLASEKKLLDVGCGAGGTALKIAETTGCNVIGIDVHEQAISAAKSLAAKRNLTGRTEFHVVSAARKIPFQEFEFDAITCIDAINHLPDRPAAMAEWARVLKPSGRLLFTDPITMTGPLSKEEIVARSPAGFFLFVPADYDRAVLEQCGLRILLSDDVTESTFQIARKRLLARSGREDTLRKIEGDANFAQQQLFLEVAARVAQERRLSRFLYVAEKPV